MHWGYFFAVGDRVYAPMGQITGGEDRGSAYGQEPGWWSRGPQTRGLRVLGRVHAVFVLPQGGSFAEWM